MLRILPWLSGQSSDLRLFPALLACFDLDRELVVMCQKTSAVVLKVPGGEISRNVTADRRLFAELIDEKVRLITPELKINDALAEERMAALAECVLVALKRETDPALFLSALICENPFCRSTRVRADLLGAILLRFLEPNHDRRLAISVLTFCCERFVDGSVAPFRLMLCDPVLFVADQIGEAPPNFSAAIAATFSDLSEPQHFSTLILKIVDYRAILFHSSGPAQIQLSKHIVDLWSRGVAQVEIRALIDLLPGQFQRQITDWINDIGTCDATTSMMPPSRASESDQNVLNLPEMAGELLWPAQLRAMEEVTERAFLLDGIVAQRFRERCPFFSRFRTFGDSYIPPDCELRKYAFRGVYHPEKNEEEATIECRGLKGTCLFAARKDGGLLLEGFDATFKEVPSPGMRAFLTEVYPSAARFEGHPVIHTSFRASQLKAATDGLAMDISNGLSVIVRLLDREKGIFALRS
jgi:hypothetical protein